MIESACSAVAEGGETTRQNQPAARESTAATRAGWQADGAFCRTWFLPWLVLCLTVAMAAAQMPRVDIGQLKQGRTSTQPNIIFILADDLGYGDLGCYGQQKIKTPNLDRLASEGMRFTQCYAGSTVCAPSRACLMTGMHTGHARIRGNDPVPLAPEDVTVAEILKSAGYRTGAVGKWGMGLQGTPGIPTRQGFDDWFGFLDQTLAHNYYPTELWRNEAVFSVYQNAGGARGLYVQDLFSKVSSNYVRIMQPFPFFLYAAYTLPHANNELGKATGNGMQIPSDAPYSKKTWPAAEKNKAAMITRLDRDVGALMRTLKEQDLEHCTVVFFSSDNGPHAEGGVKADFFNSSGPLRGIKRDLFEGGIRVPLLVRWPEHIKPGSISHHTCALWDFLPTAAEIAGVRPPKGIDGISFLPTLLGQKQTNQHEYLYWEFHEKGSKQAVRAGDWKAIRLEPGKPLELFNLKSDLRETNNVAAANPQVVEKMESILKQARTESENWPLQTAAEQDAARQQKTAPQPKEQ